MCVRARVCLCVCLCACTRIGPLCVTSVPRRFSVSSPGLDMYFSRVTPANAFDVLSSNFNRPLLVSLTFALVTVTLIARHFVARKKLKARWA